jgi:hypothetical protein
MAESNLAITFMCNGSPTMDEVNTIKNKLKEHFLTDRVLVISGFEYNNLIITELNNNGKA